MNNYGCTGHFHLSLACSFASAQNLTALEFWVFLSVSMLYFTLFYFILSIISLSLCLSQSFLGAAPAAYRRSQARDRIRALQLLAYTTATAMWDLSRICDLNHSSWHCWILNPLSEARDWTWVLMDTSHVHFCGATMGTPLCYIINVVIMRLFPKYKKKKSYSEKKKFPKSCKIQSNLFTVYPLGAWLLPAPTMLRGPGGWAHTGNPSRSLKPAVRGGRPHEWIH